MCSIDGCHNRVLARGLCSAHYQRMSRYGDPLGKPKRETKAEWLRKNSIHDGNECLIFPYYKRPSGYGECYVDGEKIGAHRYMCKLVNGEPPDDGYYAVHTCGKGHKGCVNPKHLEWATPSDNQRHRVLHGTSNRGSRSPLSENDVRKIRTKYRDGDTQEAIARIFGVSRATVGNIVTRTTWGWLA